MLFVRGLRARRYAPDAHAGEDAGFSWVFLVPALDEEVTIRDSVARLLALPLARRQIVVIDDASSDRTPEILAAMAHARPARAAPRASRRPEGQGRGAQLRLSSAGGARRRAPDRDRVIVVVVDADGRLDARAPRFAAAHFADPTVGGVQALVRIYNRQRLLTWMQDVEFGVYG